MAHTEKLGRWLVDNADEIKLDVQNSSWTEEWIPGFFDMRVQIEVAGKKYQGRGFDDNEDLAFVKGGAEALERLICDEHNLRSNGVAVHTDKAAAIVGAKLELIERDLILCHHFCSVAPKSILDFESDRVNFKKIKEKLKKEEIDIELYQLISNEEISAIHCVASDKTANRFGFIMGSACAVKFETSCIQAVNECLTNVVAFLYGAPQQMLTLEEFNIKTSHNPTDHAALYLSPKSNSFLNYLKDSPKKSLEKNIDLRSIDVTELKSSYPILASAPIFCYKAASQTLQSVFYGPTQSHDLNFTLLHEFGSGGQDFNFVPHPIG